MKTLTMIFLILALVAPGTALADPKDGASSSFWQSVVAWFADALPDMAGNVDPVVTASQKPENRSGASGYMSSELTVDGEDSIEKEASSDDPPILEMGGNVDPVG